MLNIFQKCHYHLCRRCMIFLKCYICIYLNGTTIFYRLWTFFKILHGRNFIFHDIFSKNVMNIFLTHFLNVMNNFMNGRNIFANNVIFLHFYEHFKKAMSILLDVWNIFRKVQQFLNLCKQNITLHEHFLCLMIVYKNICEVISRIKKTDKSGE